MEVNFMAITFDDKEKKDSIAPSDYRMFCGDKS